MGKETEVFQAYSIAHKMKSNYKLLFIIQENGEKLLQTNKKISCLAGQRATTIRQVLEGEIGKTALIELNKRILLDFTPLQRFHSQITFSLQGYLK